MGVGIEGSKVFEGLRISCVCVQGAVVCVCGCKGQLCMRV